MNRSSRTNIPRLRTSYGNTSLAGTTYSNENHFLTDGSHFEWTFEGLKDYAADLTMDRIPNLLREWTFKQKVGSMFFNGLVWIMILCFYHFFMISAKITDMDSNSMDFQAKTIRKIEDDLKQLKNEMIKKSERPIESPSSLFESRFELFKEKFESDLVETINERLKKIDSEIRMMGDSFVNYELINRMNEETDKKLDQALKDKLKHTNRQDLDETMLNNSIRMQIENFIFDDQIDRPDYAAELNNAKVIDSSPTYTDPDVFTLFSIPLYSVSSPPSELLKRNSPRFLDHNSRPWRMNSDEGFVKIKLAEPVIPVSFAYEHAIKRNLLKHNHISCSPKVFRVFGYENEQSDESIALGRFDFKINGHTETEFLFDRLTNKISVIQFNIEANHGNSNYTCLHRLKVF